MTMDVPVLVRHNQNTLHTMLVDCDILVNFVGEKQMGLKKRETGLLLSGRMPGPEAQWVSMST